MIVGRYKSQPFVPRRLRKYLPALHWLVGKRAEIPESDVRKELASRYEKRLEFEEMRNTLSRRGGRQPEDFQSLWWLGYHLRSLLHRNDCLGMAASIEARFPFLDTAVVRDAVNMPYRWKVHFSLRARTNSHRLICDKWVLREVARRYIPESLSHRPKTGFPAAAWRRMEYLWPFPQLAIAKCWSCPKDRWNTCMHIPAIYATKLLHLEVWAHVCLDAQIRTRCLPGCATQSS